MPRSDPSIVRRCPIADSAASLAIPKSRTLGSSPCFVRCRNTFDGLMSRWTTPAACAAASAAHTGTTISAQRTGWSGPRSSSSFSSECPSSSSITRYATPPGLTAKSKTATAFGCCTRQAEIALPPEARERLGIGAGARRQDLDGDVAVQLEVPRSEHRAEAAAADRRVEAVAPAQNAAGHRLGGAPRLDRRGRLAADCLCRAQLLLDAGERHGIVDRLEDVVVGAERRGPRPRRRCPSSRSPSAPAAPRTSASRAACAARRTPSCRAS